MGPGDCVDEEIENDEPWDKEDEVFANAKLTIVVDVKELIEAKKNWGEVFDLIFWSSVDITDKRNAIEASKEL